jgi:predicted ABC-type ATPase
MSTWDFAQKSGFMMADAQLPTNVLDKVKAIRSKDFDTLRGKRYPINPSDYPAFFEKGGRVDEKEFFESAKRESREMKIERLMSEKAYERSFLEKMPDSKLMALYDSEFFYEDERFEKGGKIGFEGLARKVAKRYEGKPVPNDYQSEYGKTYSKDEAMEVGRKVAAKVYRQQQAKMEQGGFVAIYNGNKISLEADSLYAAKKKAIEELKIPKSKQGLLSIMTKGSMMNKDFRFMSKGGSVSSSDKAWAVKVMLDDKEVENFMVRARSLKEAREMVEDYHEAKMEAKYGDDIYFAIEEAMAEGGKLTNGKDKYEKGDEGMFEGDEVRVINLNTGVGKYEYVILDEEGNVKTKGLAPKEKFDRQFRYFPKMAKGGSIAKDSSIDKLWSKVRNASKKIYEESAGYVVYLNDDTLNIGDYKDIKLYSAQADADGEVSVTLVKSPYSFKFTNAVDEKIEDRSSYDKYGGLIYIIEPLTESIAKLLLETSTLKKYEKGGMMAKGGALYHRLMPGDEVLEIYKDYLIIENDWDFIYVIDFRPEVAKRIQVEEIEGENTIEAAKRVADRDFEYSKYAMGGSLYTHGLEEGDLIVEDEGAYINVLSEDGKIYYVDLGKGERTTEPPLPFEYGGKVKVFNIGTLAAKYGKKPQVVLEALREGADVEEEHTRDRVKAMQIAFDHLEEDFFYYPKLKAAQGGVDFEDNYEKGGQVPKQFLDSKGERKIDRKSIAELTDYVMALPQTKSIYFNEEAGEYVPSRRKLHADIINTFKKEVVCITEGQPIAIFMGGSPASGKSSFLRKYSPYLLKEEILKVDADEIRAMLPEYEGYNAAQTHLETKDIVNTLLSDRNIGIPCDFDLIYDGTMNSVKSYIPLMDILRKRGYKIFIVYMDNVPKDVIIKRALERYQKSGRFVPLEVIEDFFEKGKTAFNELKKDVDGYMVIDGSNQDYKIIEQGGIKLPQNREYSMLGEKIEPKDIPALYKKGGKTKKA